MAERFIYLLRCDDCTEFIVGDRPLKLTEAVQKALDAMSDDEILRPDEDWFQIVVNILCQQTDFDTVVPLNDIDVEEMYWDEHDKREAKNEE